MLARLLVSLLLVASTAGCARKQAPPQAPASTLDPAKESAPAPDGSAGAASEGETGSDGTLKGDPCDGGEAK
ncbi:MAG: hypothetical protein H0X17_10240 [Deltaproteobacteria bacterium]|nr:hypothetical protein [Deltaproteobacteria bacterium]